MQILRPMLAARLKDPEDIVFPVLGTPKLDGIRCLKVDGKAVSRAFKPIRNRHIAELIESSLPDGVDGELILRGADFSDSQSGVMSADGKPDFVYAVFDWASEQPYCERVSAVRSLVFPWVQPLVPKLLSSLKEFYNYEAECLKAGYEGVCIRSPTGPYKFGRSTLREGHLLKYKRYQDSEAIILSLEEAMENQNPIVRNVWGKASRPGGAEGKVEKDTMGGMVVRDIHSGTVFSIGTGKGLTAALRQAMWDNEELYIGKIIRYTYQSVGAKDRPRFPSFQNFIEVE